MAEPEVSLENVRMEREVANLKSQVAYLKGELGEALFCQSPSTIIPFVNSECAEGKFSKYHITKATKVLHDASKCRVLETHGENDGQSYAIKQYHKVAVLSCRAANRIKREASILKCMDHPSIVTLLECWQSKYHIYFAFESHEQDLYHFSTPYGKGMPMHLVTAIARDCFSALAYLHKHQIYHLDLKPENIVIDGAGTADNPLKASIIDFGCSRRYEDLDAGGTLSGLCGSSGFFSPEMLTQDPYRPAKCDAFSFGCVLLELLMGHIWFQNMWLSAYEANNEHAGLCETVENTLSMISNESDMITIIKGLLSVNPMSRTEIRELHVSPYTDTDTDCLSGDDDGFASALCAKFPKAGSKRETYHDDVACRLPNLKKHRERCDQYDVSPSAQLFQRILEANEDNDEE